MAIRRPLTVQDNRDKKHAATDFLHDQLGTVGADAVVMLTDPSDFDLDFATAGARLAIFPSSAVPHVVTTMTGPALSGLMSLLIDNGSGDVLDITWPSNVEWGTAGAPVVPDNTRIQCLFAWDAAGARFHGSHNAPSPTVRSVTFDFDAGVTLSSGSRQHVLPGMPFDFQVQSWRLRTRDVSGSIKVDVRVRGDDTDMVSGDSICGSLNRPYLSAERGREETDLSAWSTTLIAAGDRLGFHVDFADIVALRGATLMLYGVQA